jgi:hypothetical protein
MVQGAELHVRVQGERIIVSLPGTSGDRSMGEA